MAAKETRMEFIDDPVISYLAVGSNPQEARRKIKKAIADLQELDKQADLLENSLIKFLNEDACAHFSQSMHKPVKRLRHIISCYIKEYQKFLAEYK